MSRSDLFSKEPVNTWKEEDIKYWLMAFGMERNDVNTVIDTGISSGDILIDMKRDDWNEIDINISDKLKNKIHNSLQELIELDDSKNKKHYNVAGVLIPPKIIATIVEDVNDGSGNKIICIKWQAHSKYMIKLFNDKKLAFECKENIQYKDHKIIFRSYWKHKFEYFIKPVKSNAKFEFQMRAVVLIKPEFTAKNNVQERSEWSNTYSMDTIQDDGKYNDDSKYSDDDIKGSNDGSDRIIDSNDDMESKDDNKSSDDTKPR